MSLKARLRQATIIFRLETGRAFLNKRAFWVYFLALLPTGAFFLHSLDVKVTMERYARRGIVDPSVFASLPPGSSAEQVLALAGKPIFDRRFPYRAEGKGKRAQGRHLRYFDGANRIDLIFVDNRLKEKTVTPVKNFEEDRVIFATIFQMFYLRLAVFFGCLGIFMNLFRGEMLDRTLHFWLLAPIRREVLFAGKYAAGLLASVVIFSLGAILAFMSMLAPHSSAEVEAYLNQSGYSHLMSYLLATVMGCAGYGSVFLAAGMLLRNPIVPAAVLLLWENGSAYLPSSLQKVSILHYLQGLCPVRIPVGSGVPALVRLFIQPVELPSPRAAVLGLTLLTLCVLLLAARASRKLQINYTTD